MRFAYADPPYPGQVRPGGTEVNHRLLIAHLVQDFPDGWALSTGSKDLQDILPLCPPKVRVMAWVKPLVFFKPGVRVAYAWEPAIVSGGRKKTARWRTHRDWVSANATSNGSKPWAFFFWLFAVMGAEPGDEFEDIFPGTGNGSKAFLLYTKQRQMSWREVWEEVRNA